MTSQEIDLGRVRGDPGKDAKLTISSDGFWVINDVKTSTKAQGDKGDKPVITINSNGFWVIDGVPTTQKAQGNDGKGIKTVAKTSTSGLVDTYTITYSDNSTSTFTVTNGAKGDEGPPGPVDPQLLETLLEQSTTINTLNSSITKLDARLKKLEPTPIPVIDDYIFGLDSKDAIIGTNPSWVEKTGNYTVTISQNNVLTKNNNALVFNMNTNNIITTNLNQQSLGNSFTLETVFKQHTGIGEEFGVILGNANASGGFCFIRLVNVPSLKNEILYNFNNIGNIEYDYPQNEFIHAVLTYDGTSTKAYINGELKGTTNTKPALANRNFSIGEGDTRNTNTRAFRGELRHLNIFNYALTPSDIETNYEYYI